MSSRALRKAQREREEQEELKNLAAEETSDVDSEEEAINMTQKSAFAMLEEEEDEAEENGGVSIEPDEVESEAQEGSPAAIHSANLAKSKRKKKKKKPKANGSAASEVSVSTDKQLDEIDRALKELSANGNTSTGSTSAGVDADVDETSKLLAIDSRHLHAQNEMRRLFGRAALEHEAEDDEQPQNANVGGNRRQQRRVQQVGLAQALRGQGGHGGRSAGLAAIALKRNIFVQGKEEWPSASGGGLSMEIEERRADGTVLYRFVHNRIYQDVQAQFKMSVETMDPNSLIALLQHNPYHISTLLQVSEIAKQERDHTTSGDLLERALFSFGRAVHSTFAKNLADGKARLDFGRAENRELWLASYRYMANLSMRGTWRTVYEWAKLLLSLSPDDDPYAIWLVLDQFALRARQDLDYLNISRNANCRQVHGNQANVQFGQGLAEFRAGNKSKGRQALFTAIGRFPWIVARLMQELSLDPPTGIWGKEARSAREKLQTELYATRAKDLWNTPENGALLVEIAAAIPPNTPEANADVSDITRNEARHVLLSDIPALIAFVPRHFTAELTSTSDPLPPTDSHDFYIIDNERVGDGSTRAPTEEEISELRDLYAYVARVFAMINGEEEQDANGNELERRMRAAGVDEAVFARNSRRLAALQRIVGPDSGALGLGREDLEVAGRENDLVQRMQAAPDASLDERMQQARVEDVEDAQD